MSRDIGCQDDGTLDHCSGCSHRREVNVIQQAQRIIDAVAIVDKLQLSDIEKEALIRFIKPEDMIDLVKVTTANVVIGQTGHHLWVCTENGTVLRIKALAITLDDRRTNR